MEKYRMDVRKQTEGLGQIERLEGRILLADPWGAFPRLIQQDQAVARYGSINGAGQTVAVLDTGIDYRHPALGGGFGDGFKVVGGYVFADEDADPMDEDGHGTGVAGVIAAKQFTYQGSRYQGLAPAANLVALRIDNGDGGRAVYIERIERALQWVIANRTRYNITAVNMSLGYNAYTSAGTQGPYDDELRELHDAGVFLSASSGNGGVSSPPAIEYPGADPNVYSIGAIKSNDVISTFTERSADMDLLAP